VLALLEEPLDLMVVVGGYNSSNTCNLAAICQAKGVWTIHIEDADCIDVAAGSVRHQPIRTKDEVTLEHWLSSARRIGLTAGASTPNHKIGETVVRICESADVLAELRAALAPGG
jgi:4-hydroxy-3-methylbut-2-enyl diphosphate reductase